MKIKIIAVETTSQTKGKNTWKVAEVTYKDVEKNKTASKKVISFNYPEVFNALSNGKNGDEFDIQLSKNEESGYWDWVGVGEGAADVPANAAAASTPKKTGASTYGRDFETASERAAKQVYIVRQSSLTAALNLIIANNGGVDGITPEEVIKTAKVFEEYVFSHSHTAIEDMEDDVPL